MASRRLTDAQEQAVVQDWLDWKQTGVGRAEDIWPNHGISKETGYNVLRRHGHMPQRGELGPVPQEVVRMALEAMRATNEDLRARVHELEQELDKLRRRLK